MSLLKRIETRPSADSIMIPIMPDEEFQKLSEEEQNAQWDRELDSMTEEDWDRFYFNCSGRHLGDSSGGNGGHGRIF